MSKFKIILVATVFGFLDVGCSKADDGGNATAETHALKTTDLHAELTEDQVIATEADGASKKGAQGKQESSTIAALMAAGLTREQAEAMLVMGDGTPGSAEKAAAISAMDPRAQAEKPKSKASYVTIRFGDVDYPMEFMRTPVCGDFFGLSSASFSATRPAGEGRVSKFLFNGNRERFSFTFWRDTVPQQFDMSGADANFAINTKDGGVSGFELSNGMRGDDLNDAKIKSFVAERSNLFYDGPYSADTDNTITIEAAYCP